MKYKVKFTHSFKKAYKKIGQKDKDLLLKVIERLANDENLEEKYNDHALKDKWKNHRECHIKPNLLLIYQKFEAILILKCAETGSHNELFE